MFIKRGEAKLIKNSRREKTIQVTLFTYQGKFTCSAPSGKSTGKHEVISYHPRGIKYSLNLTKKFLSLAENKNFQIKTFKDLEKIENLIKKFEDKNGELGGNVVYVLESCFLKAASKENKKQLWEFIYDSFSSKKEKVKIPMPVGNCIGGGLHSKKIYGKRPDFQEFLLIPDEKTFSRAVTKNLHAYYYARNLLRKKDNFFRIKKNDENAWNTSLTNEEILEIMKQVSKKYKLRIGLDVAASSFVDDEGYYFYKNKKLIRDKSDQIHYIDKIIKKFGLFYVEDPLHEEDFTGFKQILSDTEKNKKKTLVVGDDLTTTNLRRVLRAVRSKTINAMIIKPNQIGSLVEVAKVVEFCKKNKVVMIFSHRSGETTDNTLADLCVGFGGDFIKTGIYGKERMIKLKRILDIEKSLK